MTTALDTNVLVTLLLADVQEDVVTAQAALEGASHQGELMISPVVYAELLAAPRVTEPFLGAFLKETRITTDWRMTPEVWRQAGLAYLAYAKRRRKQKGDAGPRRILADFVIGAHANSFSSRFLTFDEGIYKSAFPNLNVTILPNSG